MSVMKITELERDFKVIKTDAKRWKKTDALLAGYNLERQRLAQTPPRKNDLGGVRQVEADMAQEELDMCGVYHTLLVTAFDRAISLRKKVEESGEWDEPRFQRELQEFGDKCWRNIDGPCRKDVPRMYFLIMLPHVYSLMEILKQRKKIKPNKKMQAG